MALAASVRAVVQEVDPNLPVSNTRCMADIVAESLGSERFSTVLLTLFAALALLLAAIGIFGVLSYSVSQRTRELGIHMAMGASGQRVLTMVVRQGMVPVLLGVGVGLAGALGLTRFLASQVHGVPTTDPLVFSGVALVLLVVALAASFVPARRATRVDPMNALRCE
jgi:putative ABC transport system permease protein